MPYSTVERVDCMVTEQYNLTHCEVNPRFQRNAEFSLGILMVLEGISWQSPLMPIILRQDESLIKVAHRHVIFLIPIFFTWPLLVVAVFVARYLLNFDFFGYWGLALTIVVLLVVLIILYKCYIWRNNALIITSQRVIKNEQRGFFSKTVTELLYHDILETSYSKDGIAASTYDYGDLQIRTASENKIVIEGISDPDKVVELINRVRHGDLTVESSNNTEAGAQ